MGVGERKGKRGFEKRDGERERERGGGGEGERKATFFDTVMQPLVSAKRNTRRLQIYMLVCLSPMTQYSAVIEFGRNIVVTLYRSTECD